MIVAPETPALPTDRGACLLAAVLGLDSSGHELTRNEGPLTGLLDRHHEVNQRLERRPCPSIWNLRIMALQWKAADVLDLCVGWPVDAIVATVMKGDQVLVASIRHKPPIGKIPPA